MTMGKKVFGKILAKLPSKMQKGPADSG